MAPPAAITYHTVTGRYVDATGAAMAGTVTFTPLASRIVDATDGALIALKPVRASLDGTGSFSVSLMVGDDPDVDPSGWSYQVDEVLVGGSVRLTDTYTVTLTTAGSSPIGLATLVPGSAAAVSGGLVRPSMVAKQLTSFTAVSNTTSDTAVATLTIPIAGTALGSALLFEAGGTLVNSSGGSINHVLKIKLGGTTVLTTAATAVGNDANNSEWWLRAHIVYPTATTQRVTAVMSVSAAGSGNWGADGPVTVGYGTASETMAAATDVALTATPASASASYSMQATWATLSRLA